jgi:hypothetical protein
MVGGDNEHDACGAVGVVLQLAGKELPVLSGPGADHLRVDGIAPGARVWMCDPQGAWLGIVYGSPGTNCQVSTPRAVRQPYDGPCASGWVNADHIGLWAG